MIRALKYLLYGMLSHNNYPSLATAICAITASLWVNAFTVALALAAILHAAPIRTLSPSELAVVMIVSLASLFVTLHVLLTPIGRKYLARRRMSSHSSAEQHYRSGRVLLYFVVTAASFAAMALWIKYHLT